MTKTVTRSACLLSFVVVVPLLGGCAALVGAGATAGVYEYQNKEAIEDLDKAYKRQELTRQNYLERRDDIGGRSLVY